MFRAFSRPSSGAQWPQWQPLVLPSYRGDSRAIFVVGPVYTGIMVWYMCVYMVCGESSVCGYTGIAIEVITGHIKAHLKSKYKKNVITFFIFTFYVYFHNITYNLNITTFLYLLFICTFMGPVITVIAIPVYPHTDNSSHTIYTHIRHTIMPVLLQLTSLWWTFMARNMYKILCETKSQQVCIWLDLHCNDQNMGPNV